MSLAKTADLTQLKLDKNKKDSNTNGNKKFLFIAIGILSIGIIIFIFSGNLFKKSIEVKTSIVTLSSEIQSSSVLTASGFVVARRKAALSSKSFGRLIYLGVEEGDVVKSGELIGRIESNDVEANLGQTKASLAMSKANLAQAEAELEEAKNNFIRIEKLLNQNLTSQAEFETAKARYKRAEASTKSFSAAIEASKAAVKSAEVAVENTFIRAPFDGTVLTKNADVGEVITSMGAAIGSRGALVTLADMNSLEVEADVSESNLEKVKINQPCEVSLDAYPSKKYKAKLFKIIPTADRAKATVKTRIQFLEKDEKVLPEMSAKILFLDETKIDTSKTKEGPKIIIPASAIISTGNEKKAFVVNENNIQLVNLILGGIAGNGIEVKSGVNDGDEVVINPSSDLNDGDEVVIKNE